MRAQLSPNWQNTPPAYLGNPKPETGINSHLKRVRRSTEKNSGFHPNSKSGFHPKY